MDGLLTLLAVFLVLQPVIASPESENKKEANSKHDEQIKDEQHTEIKLRIMEQNMQSELSKISDIIMNMKAEVARLIDFNNSIQIMHDTHDRNHKDIMSVSEWLHAFSQESNEKIKYIYSILQNLTDYKIVSEYDMDKVKPVVEKVTVFEEKLNMINKRLDVTSDTLSEARERLDKLSEKYRKAEKEKDDVTSKLDEIKAELRRLYDRFPEMQSKIDSLDEILMAKKDEIINIKQQIEKLEDGAHMGQEAETRIEDIGAKVTKVEKQITLLKESMIQATKDGDGDKISQDILRSIKQDFENDFKKLENKVKRTAKNIENNKVKYDKSMKMINELTTEIHAETEQRTSLSKDIVDIKKRLKDTGNELNSKLVSDMALQSDHFRSLISEESGKQDRKMSLMEKKVTKKLEKLEEKAASNQRNFQENEKSLKVLSSNHESHKSDIYKMITNLQNELESASKDTSKSQQTFEKLHQTVSHIEESFVCFDTVVLLFVCLGVVDVVLIIVIIKKTAPAPGKDNSSTKNTKLSDDPKKSSSDIDRSVCTVSFNLKGKKQHRKITESLLVDSNFSLVSPVVINTEEDIQKISSKVVLVFMDNNEKVESTNDLKWKTIQKIQKYGGEVFVVFYGDSGSKQLGEDEIVNSKLIQSKQMDLKSLASRKRLYSVFKDFTTFQKEEILTEFAELL